MHPVVARLAMGTLLLAALADCRTASIGRGMRQTSTTAPARGDGTLIRQSPCPVLATPAAHRAAIDDYYREDIEQAGLGDVLAGRSADLGVPYAESRNLQAMSRDGRCLRVAYSSDGLQVTGFLLRPAAPGPHPVLLWLRGGNREFGRIEPVTLLNLAWFADQGFLVVAPQYRGVDGGEGADEMGGADVDDVFAIVALARAQADADPARLYLLGGSRGAMEGLVAMRRGLAVRAAAFRGGLYDMRAVLASRPEMGEEYAQTMPDYADDPVGALQRRSAVDWAGELDAPILLLHGDRDWRVEPATARDFDAALARAGVPHRLLMYAGDEHQLLLHRPGWMVEARDWFLAH